MSLILGALTSSLSFLYLPVRMMVERTFEEPKRVCRPFNFCLLDGAADSWYLDIDSEITV